MPQAIEPRALLVVRLDDRPGRIGGVGVEEHRLLGLGVILPFVERQTVDRRKFPLFQRLVLARIEARGAALLGDREPVFVEADAVADQHALQLRRLAHEFEIFGRRAEAHHPLHPRPIVPGAVEEDDLAGRGQMFDVALEKPLRPLALGGLVERHHARAARVEMLHVAFDRAALAGRVAALEDHHDPLAVSRTHSWTFRSSIWSLAFCFS